jgi:hypothetical protein
LRRPRTRQRRPGSRRASRPTPRQSPAVASLASTARCLTGSRVARARRIQPSVASTRSIAAGPTRVRHGFQTSFESLLLQGGLVRRPKGLGVETNAAWCGDKCGLVWRQMRLGVETNAAWCGDQGGFVSRTRRVGMETNASWCENQGGSVWRPRRLGVETQVASHGGRPGLVSVSGANALNSLTFHLCSGPAHDRGRFLSGRGCLARRPGETGARRPRR